MNTRKRTKPMFESALMIAIAIVLIFSGMYVPFLGFAVILLPVPFVIIGVRHGLRYNIISLVAAMILISTFQGLLITLAIFIVVGFSSLAMAYTIKRNYSFNRIIFFSVVSSLIALLLIVAVLFSFSDFDIAQQFEEAVKMNNEMNREFFMRLGIEENQLDETMKIQTLAMERMLILVPSIMFFAVSINTLINYGVTASILRRSSHYIQKPTKLSYFRLPQNILTGTMVVVVLTYIMKLVKFVKFDALLLNVIAIFSMIYLIQGLAVVSYFIEKRGVKKVLRRIILVFLFLIPTIANILPYVGLFDIMFNIRKLES